MYDYLVVGAGLFGSVFAREMVDAGKSVLVIDKRPTIAGNVYTENRSGIIVHKYGAHIFHTDDEKVWRYVNRFAAFNRYTHSPIANYRGELYSLPFNMYTFHKMWGVVRPEEAKIIIDEQRSSIIEAPRNLEEQAIQLVGKDIYERLVKGYTEKQWGRKCSELPPFIIKRLPVRFTYDNNYFESLYQGIPVGGYTHLVRKILAGIEVRLNTDFLELRREMEHVADRVIYTGPIDEFYGFRFGSLEYRTVYFETEELEDANFQGVSVVNYTDRDVPWTRIIEHKWFEFGRDSDKHSLPGTIISREYSRQWKCGEDPFYPINDEKNNSLYAKYKSLAAGESRIRFGGRLGDYKYYDMDQTILAALDCAQSELKHGRGCYT